ncbi:MAG TPA: hypothetical protein GXX19_09595 [Syntrophomonadaceae bacterium]|nr:hypothetical protein [Syntrophomonadaceae bacterium]
MASGENKKERTFIVEFWAKVFDVLRWVSLFQLLCLLARRRPTYLFVDAWVLGHLLASLLAVIYVRFSDANAFWYFILFYSYLRVFEIIVYQVNVLLFDEHRASLRGHDYYLRSYRRTVLLLLHNYCEIVFWFAASYLVLAGQFSFGKFHGSLIGVVYSSFAVMTNMGSGEISAKTLAGLYVLWAQSLIGLFMTLISLARFISILPAPRSLEEKEDGTEHHK